MKRVYFLSFAIAAVLFSCDKEDNPNPETVAVTINFAHLVDGDDVILDQILYKNVLDQEFSIKTIKYFISDLKFHKDNGDIVAFDDIHYVDIRSAETLTLELSKKIAQGNYQGISFVHGLAPAQNITGRFTEPPESLMEWPVMMGGGYHYMKLEGEYRTPTAQSFFNFHSGSLNGNAYEVNVDLQNQSFVVTDDQLHLTLQMEIQNWFTQPTDWDFTYFGSAIMGNAEAQATVQENGANVYSFVIADTQ
jgi:hypothetical protein